MDSVKVSWNVPNLITINLMAWVGFLLFILLFQTVARRKSSPGGVPAGAVASEDY